MKTYAAALGALSLTLAGCFGPGDPVVLPDNDIEAASTCFVAQGLTMREGKAEGDPVTYDEFIATINFALVAAANAETFSTDSVSEVLSGASLVSDEIAGMDYEGAVPTCDARFGIDGSATLPEEDRDAVLSCLSLAAFLNGAAEAQDAQFGEAGETAASLFDRLEERMENDPDILVMMIQGDAEQIMSEATRTAFAQGAPKDFLSQCDARFPEES